MTIRAEREGSHFVVSSLLENKPTAPFASYGLGKVGTTSAGRSGYIYLTTPARKQRRDRPERGGADTGRGYRAFPPVDFHSISFDTPSEALLPTGLPTSIYLCRDLWPTSRQACQPLRTRPWLCPPLLWAHRLVVFFSSRGAGTPCVTLTCRGEECISPDIYRSQLPTQPRTVAQGGCISISAK